MDMMLLAKVAMLGETDAKGETTLTLGDAGMTVLIGLVIVFAVLIILTLMIWAFGKIMDAASGKGKPNEEKKEAKAKPEKKASAGKKPAAEAGVTGDVVAAISAALACILGKGKFTIRKITRASSRKAWGSAGAAENVRPF